MAKAQNMTINLDEELHKASQEMRDAENASLGIGFNENQWELIRKYITSAIIQSQWTYAKSWQNLPKK